MSSALMQFSDWFGRGNDLTWYQMALRAAVIFVAAWVTLRGAGRRAFSQRTAFDLCIILLLGAVLSRAIVGASPMGATLAAALMLVSLHRLLGWLASRHRWFDRVMGGTAIDLLKHGNLDRSAMQHAMLGEEDLAANIRASLQSDSLADVERIVVERNGTVTFVKRSKEKSADQAGSRAH